MKETLKNWMHHQIQLVKLDDYLLEKIIEDFQIVLAVGLSVCLYV